MNVDYNNYIGYGKYHNLYFCLVSATIKLCLHLPHKNRNSSKNKLITNTTSGDKNEATFYIIISMREVLFEYSTSFFLSPCLEFIITFYRNSNKIIFSNWHIFVPQYVVCVNKHCDKNLNYIINLYLKTNYFLGFIYFQIVRK